MGEDSLTLKLVMHKVPQNSMIDLKFKFSSFEKTWDDDQVFAFRLPEKEIARTELVQVGQAVGGITTATTIVIVILSTVLTGVLSQLWALINGLQLIVHLPLIAAANFPGPCLMTMNELINVC